MRTSWMSYFCHRYDDEMDSLSGTALHQGFQRRGDGEQWICFTWTFRCQCLLLLFMCILYVYVWEREILISIIVFGGQIWPMRPKILHFTWYVWKWVSNLDVQELYQWMLQSRVHIVVVREIRAKLGLGRRCVESTIEYDQR